MYAGLGKDIAVEPRKCIGADTVGEQAVATDSLVQHADVMSGAVSLHSFRKNIGPAVVAIGCRCVSVGYGISQDHDRISAFGCDHVDARYLIPVVYLFGPDQVRRCDMVAMNVIGCFARTGMTGLHCRGRVEMKCDRDVRQSSYWVMNWIGDIFCTCGNDYGAHTRKFQDPV